MSLKCLIKSSGGTFVQQSGKISAIFGGGHYEEQLCEIILNLTSGSGECHLKFFLSRALVALLFGGVESGR